MQQSFRSVATGRLLESSRVSKTRQALLVPNEPDYESRGQEFESLRVRHLRTKPRTCAVWFWRGASGSRWGAWRNAMGAPPL